jgi:para-aminobenzoate synthetase component 1
VSGVDLKTSALAGLEDLGLPTMARKNAAWVCPLSVARGLQARPGAFALLAGGKDPEAHGGRWSFVGCDPDFSQTLMVSSDAAFEALRQPLLATGAVIGLMSYDAGARVATGLRPLVWPDLILARYPALLAFDHLENTIEAIGWGLDSAAADEEANAALDWLETAVVEAGQDACAPSTGFDADTTPEVYQAAVADVVERIAAGELFQANIARSWSGPLDAGHTPFDVFERLAAHSGSAYGAYWQMDDRAVVSNSPELFLTFDPLSRLIETRPIKGTRPRHEDAAQDQALASELADSAKDRAENLMIVDLMRNDLARVAVPGSVRVERLFEVETHPTVHHLVSTVVASANSAVSAADVLEASFPPGSITGAPKHQAMKVIAAHEAPRGAWCGSLFGLNLKGDAALTGSVLIRTASFERSNDVWAWRAQAGAGIVADSLPADECEETEAKISALKAALSSPSR